ncbi:hypothetical protein D9M73_298950 [compost metagenome]
MAASSSSERDCILFMMFFLCTLVVTSLVPICLAICLCDKPPTTSEKTWRSR